MSSSTVLFKTRPDKSDWSPRILCFIDIATSMKKSPIFTSQANFSHTLICLKNLGKMDRNRAD